MTQNSRITPERFGQIATKVATQTAYVAAGFADVLAGTIREVINSQRIGYQERRSEGARPVKDYARNVPDHFRGLADEVKEAYATLSDRGRAVFRDGFSETAHRDGGAQSGTEAHRPQPPGEDEQPPVS